MNVFGGFCLVAGEVDDTCFEVLGGEDGVLYCYSSGMDNLLYVVNGFASDHLQASNHQQ